MFFPRLYICVLLHYYAPADTFSILVSNWPQLPQQIAEANTLPLGIFFQGVFKLISRAAKKSKNQRLTKMHGSMKGNEILQAAEERRQLEMEKEEKKEASRAKKSEIEKLYRDCKSSCVCNRNICKAILLKECTNCRNILKSQCSKKHAEELMENFQKL